MEETSAHHPRRWDILDYLMVACVIGVSAGAASTIFTGYKNRNPIVIQEPNQRATLRSPDSNLFYKAVDRGER